MSTEHQQYSTENQSGVLTRYAEERGYTIIKTYKDSGKSGLRIDGREALQRLLSDVTSGEAEFKRILVYDVSRWGRFQDADESAYYEFACKSAGIPVEYCAEQFTNDGGPVATIVKGVKRAMAGEYSRELSQKVFLGQCNLIRRGFRQGGPAGYGLRRMLVDGAGQPKGILKAGEHKSIQTDRVVLVLGPEEELQVVRRIYRMFVQQGVNEREIAENLEAEGIEAGSPRGWTRARIHQILTNEKYIGNNVYNRVSFKLKKERVHNPPEEWVRSVGCFDAIVEEPMFHRAGGIIDARSRRLTDDELLNLLRDLVAKQAGHITGATIDDADHLPSSSAYRTRFGSLLKAYELVDYFPNRDYSFLETNRRIREMHPEIVRDVTTQLESRGASVQLADSGLIWVNDLYTASLTVTRCRTLPSGAGRWQLASQAFSTADITIAARLADGNKTVRDYYMFPYLSLDLAEKPRVQFTEDNGRYLDVFRFDTLEAFFALAETAEIPESA